MLPIQQNLTQVNYDSGNGGRKYVVIHYTGNTTDSASGNANYFKSANRGSSAHYFVDSSNIVQVVSDNDTAWAVGKNYGNNNLYGACTNRNSISIEMCSNGGVIADETFKNTVDLTKHLMEKYGIDAEHVVRHWDVCSKICPGWNGWGANGCDSSIWDKFKNDIQSNINVAEGEEEMRCLYTIDGKDAVYYFDGTKVVTLLHEDQMKVLQMIYKDNNGHDMPFYRWTSKAAWYTRLAQVLALKK